MKYTVLTALILIFLSFFHNLNAEPLKRENLVENPEIIFSLTEEGIKLSSLVGKDNIVKLIISGKIRVKPNGSPVRIPERNAILISLFQGDKEISTFPAVYSASTAEDRGRKVEFAPGKGKFINFQGVFIAPKNSSGEYKAKIKALTWQIKSKQLIFEPTTAEFSSASVVIK